MATNPKQTRRKKLSLITEEYDGIIDQMFVRRKGVPDYYYQLNAEEKEANHMIMDAMNMKVNFLKNPRYIGIENAILYSDPVTGKMLAQECPFRATPSIIFFKDYDIDQVYSQKLTLVNVDRVLRRIKFLAPGTDEFSLINAKYPSNEEGTIAPGNCIEFDILFKANSLADYSDELIIITEKNNFSIPLIAKREQPLLNLESLIECKSCWIGQNSYSEIEVINSGGHAGFWLSTEEESISHKPTDYDDTSKLMSGSFTIWPDRFYLRKGERIKLKVQFDPKLEGREDIQLYLNCDNMRQYKHSLFAIANMIEILLTEIDGESIINNPKIRLDCLYFRDCDYLRPKKREIVVENLTKNRVDYEWRFRPDNITGDTNSESFVVTPFSGRFENREKKPFYIEYKSDNFIASYPEIDLIIKNIPLQSVKNPPPHIQKLIEERQLKIERGEIDHDKTEEMVEFSYFSMKLLGHVRQLDYEIDPPLVYFPFDVPINQEQTSVFRIANNSPCKGAFSIRFISKTSPETSCRIRDIVRKEPKEDDIQKDQVKEDSYSQKLDIKVSNSIGQSSSMLGDDSGFELISVMNQNNKYTLEAFAELEIYLSFSSTVPLSLQQFIYQVEYENSAPKEFKIISSFSGPFLRICTPEIDFGIMKNWTKRTREIIVENPSEVDARAIVRMASSSMLDFEAIGEALEEDGFSNLDFLFNSGKVRITPYYFEIPSKSKQKVTIEFCSEDPETFEEILEVVPEFGEIEMIKIICEIQEPIVALSRTVLSYPTLYANKVYALKTSRDPNSIVLRNLGNIPTDFEWEDINHDDIIQSAVQPKSGTLEPKSEILIKFKFIVKLYGKFSFLFKCNLSACDLPLGFRLDTQVFGLDVYYEVAPKENELSFLKRKMLKKKNKNLNTLQGEASLAERSVRTQSSKMGSTAVLEKLLKKGEEFTKLEFLGLEINEPTSTKFLIKNLSGIKTTFRLSFENYQSDANPISIVEEGESSMAKTQGASSTFKKSFSKAFTISTDSVKKTNMSKTAKPPKLVNERIERTHVFYSSNGMKHTKAKRERLLAENYLSNDKGIAIVCIPEEGTLNPHSQLEINVSVFNEIAGSYADTLIAEVRGLEPVKFPVTLFIKGSPLIITTDQVGLNISEEPYMLDFGGMLINTEPLKKPLRIDNTGTQPLKVELYIYSIDELDRNRDEFIIRFDNPVPGTKNVCSIVWDAIEPEETAKEPFKLNVKTIIVPPKSNYKLTVTYCSDQIKTYNSVLVAKPSFLNEEAASRFELGHMAVRLRGSTFLPKLDLITNPNMDGKFTYTFIKWSAGRSPKQVKTILLFNKLPALLKFSCSLSGPFTLLGTSADSQDFSQTAIDKMVLKNETFLNTAKDTGLDPLKKYKLSLQNLEMQTQTSLGIIVQFMGYDIADYDNWPNSSDNFVNGALKVAFENGMTQEIELNGKLMRPKLMLNTKGFEPCDEETVIDFGLVHTSDQVMITFWLSNKSIVPAEWKIYYVPFPEKTYFGAATVTKLEKENIEKTDDPDVFIFNRKEGVNAGGQAMLNKLPGGNAFRIRRDPKYMSKKEIDAEENFRKLYPEKVKVIFKPKLNILYKTKYKIGVKGGPSLFFYLKGRGTYEEKYKKPLL